MNPFRRRKRLAVARAFLLLSLATFGTFRCLAQASCSQKRTFSDEDAACFDRGSTISPAVVACHEAVEGHDNPPEKSTTKRHDRSRRFPYERWGQHMVLDCHVHRRPPLCALGAMQCSDFSPPSAQRISGHSDRLVLRFLPSHSDLQEQRNELQTRPQEICGPASGLNEPILPVNGVIGSSLERLPYLVSEGPSHPPEPVVRPPGSFSQRSADAVEEALGCHKHPSDRDIAE